MTTQEKVESVDKRPARVTVSAACQLVDLAPRTYYAWRQRRRRWLESHGMTMGDYPGGRQFRSDGDPTPISMSKQLGEVHGLH